MRWIAKRAPRPNQASRASIDSQRSIIAMDSRLFSEHEVVREAQPETQHGVGLTDSDAIRMADSSVLCS